MNQIILSITSYLVSPLKITRQGVLILFSTNYILISHGSMGLVLLYAQQYYSLVLMMIIVIGNVLMFPDFTQPKSCY